MAGGATLRVMYEVTPFKPHVALYVPALWGGGRLRDGPKVSGWEVEKPGSKHKLSIEAAFGVAFLGFLGKHVPHSRSPSGPLGLALSLCGSLSLCPSVAGVGSVKLLSAFPGPVLHCNPLR